MDYLENHLPRDLINIIDDLNDPYIDIKDAIVKDVIGLQLLYFLSDGRCNECIRPSWIKSIMVPPILTRDRGYYQNSFEESLNYWYI